MKIKVKVKPNAKQNVVTKISESEFGVSVKAKPKDGMANQALVETLAEYFKVSKSAVKIIAGHKARQKLVEIF